jgi:hypothetical protein
LGRSHSREEDAACKAPESLRLGSLPHRPALAAALGRGWTLSSPAPLAGPICRLPGPYAVWRGAFSIVAAARSLIDPYCRLPVALQM